MNYGCSFHLAHGNVNNWSHINVRSVSVAGWTVKSVNNKWELLDLGASPEYAKKKQLLAFWAKTQWLKSCLTLNSDSEISSTVLCHCAAYRPRLRVVPAVGRSGSEFFSLHSAWRGKLLLVHSNVELRSHVLSAPTASLQWSWKSWTSSFLTWWLLPFSPYLLKRCPFGKGAPVLLRETVAILHASLLQTIHLVQVSVINSNLHPVKCKVSLLICICSNHSFNFRAPSGKRRKLYCCLRTQLLISSPRSPADTCTPQGQCSWAISPAITSACCFWSNQTREKRVNISHDHPGPRLFTENMPHRHHYQWIIHPTLQGAFVSHSKFSVTGTGCSLPPQVSAPSGQPH